MRLLLFIAFAVGIVLVLNFKQNQSIPVSNTPFDFEKVEAEHLLKKKLIQELTAKKTTPPPPVPGPQKTSSPLVELTSDELKRGHQLYKKCIICHGKSGGGKKSQKSPAIGGQYSWYLKDQLTLMQKQIRINKTMFPYIKKLSPQDIEELATYISKLPWAK